MRARHAKAVAVGASAALAYLGGARVRDTMPVRGTTLLALATVAISAMVSARNTATTLETRNRLNAFLDGTQTPDGSHVHGHLTIHGNHQVTGTHTVTGNSTLHTADFGGDTDHGGHHANHLRWLNYTTSSGLDVNDQFGVHYGLWLNGSTLHSDGSTWP